ncbi:hypothetical protein BT96DRAFT_1007181 [Gymnopus androsaceus JB14]|uniref:Uncharacterized protein n=1 Tax=Gymnopus androsaceus JB14 TaxID=1447944 RepID=A0A6A4GIS7_9AGAR|nr:hypothetical protein BT96DRAFT_1007181 [Gymnopus androsaceus JB14]
MLTYQADLDKRSASPRRRNENGVSISAQPSAQLTNGHQPSAQEGYYPFGDPYNSVVHQLGGLGPALYTFGDPQQLQQQFQPHLGNAPQWPSQEGGFSAGTSFGPHINQSFPQSDSFEGSAATPMTPASSASLNHHSQGDDTRMVSLNSTGREDFDEEERRERNLDLDADEEEPSGSRAVLQSFDEGIQSMPITLPPKKCARLHHAGVSVLHSPTSIAQHADKPLMDHSNVSTLYVNPPRQPLQCCAHMIPPAVINSQGSSESSNKENSDVTMSDSQSAEVLMLQDLRQVQTKRKLREVIDKLYNLELNDKQADVCVVSRRPGYRASDLPSARKTIVDLAYGYFRNIFLERSAFPQDEGDLHDWATMAWYKAVDYLIQFRNHIGQPEPVREELTLIRRFFG